MNLHANTAEVLENKPSTNGAPSDQGQVATITPPRHGNKIIEQFYQAILDPKGLSLDEWLGIQESIKEIERLAPHIELIVRLRREKKSA